MPLVAQENQIIESRVLRAPRELVFRMFTEAEHITHWWGPRGFRTHTKLMDVRPGGLWTHTMIGPDGVEYPNEVRYEIVDAPGKLVYEHINDPLFRATITFTEKSAQETEVLFVMDFLDVRLRNAVAERGAVEGLQDTLARFEEVLSTYTGEEFVLTRELNAPRELVYRSWTEPERLEKWFGPVGTKLIVKRADIREGGHFVYGMQLPDGNTMWGRWTFRDLTPLSRIVLVTSFVDENEQPIAPPMAKDFPIEMLSTTTFEERDGKTLVTLRSRAMYASPVQQHTFAGFFQSMEQGWGGTFGQLIAYLEREQA